MKYYYTIEFYILALVLLVAAILTEGDTRQTLIIGCYIFTAAAGICQHITNNNETN